MPPAEQTRVDERRFKAMPKVLLHEHMNCSLRADTMLEFYYDDNWRVPADFPVSVRRSFEHKDTARAKQAYQTFLAEKAGKSLANYVEAIAKHILPLVQSTARLTRVAKERIEDAQEDGVIALELRFAPQNHLAGGLKPAQVMDAMIAGISSAPLPVRLVVCALRHENEETARQLADLCIAYKEHVGVFDLAGDERANPGVLTWWARQAHRVREHGIDVNIHLWETDEPTNDDLDRLSDLGVKRLGHGLRGSVQGDRVLEVCPTSNVVTGQIESFAEHPVDRLYREGKRVTVNTDGTLLTGSDLSNEYQLLNRFFGWSEPEFFTVNKTAIEASSFSEKIKREIMNRLSASYLQARC